jgi:hypothetical protein
MNDISMFQVCAEKEKCFGCDVSIKIIMAAISFKGYNEMNNTNL